MLIKISHATISQRIRLGRRFEEIITRCITEKETQVGQLNKEIGRKAEEAEEARGANSILLEQLDALIAGSDAISEAKKVAEREIESLQVSLTLQWSVKKLSTQCTTQCTTQT